MLQGDVVVYDGACGFCTWAAEWVRQRDRHDRLRFTPYQATDLETLSPGLTPEIAAHSVYLVTRDGRRYHGARAVFETLRRLPGVWGVIGAVGAFPLFSLLAQPFYRLFANNRTYISTRLGLMACAVIPPRQAE